MIRVFMKKILCIRIIVAIIFTSMPIAGLLHASDAKFVPCQYKNTYKYYMSQGDEFFANNQLESARISYKRALLVQPNSGEARTKINTIDKRLSSSGISEGPEPVRLRRSLKPRRKRLTSVEGETVRATDSVSEDIYSNMRHRKAKVSEEVVKKDEGRYEVAKVPRRESLDKLSEPTTEPSYSKARNLFDKGSIDLLRTNNSINDKLQGTNAKINEFISPATLKGEYRLAFGFTPEDAIWKDANADKYNVPGDVNFRYIFGQDRHNTFDKKIYSRIRLELDSPILNRFSTYNEIVVDPWTFVGKKRVFVTGTGGDAAELDLKYWSNTRRTINETYRTTKGDIINVGENKIVDEKTTGGSHTGLTDWGSNRFSIPESEIDRMFVPIRKSWIEYKGEPVKAKLFLMSDQDEALTSDDPMRLSNNKVWWEESPWLDSYEASRVFQRAGTSAPSGHSGTKEPVKKGQWVRNLSFVARDSENQRLTFLRGGALNTSFANGTSLKMVAASPRNLWDRYEQASSLPAAVRVKTPISETVELGGLYTLKTGIKHGSVEAVNNLGAVDISYDAFENTELLAEVAASRISVEEANGYDNKETGFAWMLGLKNKGLWNILSGPGNKYGMDMSFTHMENEFYPGLSNYRFTRKEFEIAKHIYFDEIRPENKDIMVGDGIDVGRYSFNAGADLQINDSIDTRLDFRSVHTDGGDFVENAYRLAVDYEATPRLTLKGLGYYLYLPESTVGMDPLINAKNSYTAFTDYFAYEDLYLQNTAVEGGEDPSIGAFSGGLNYDFTDYFSGSGILEVTNDPKDWPRGLLNNVFVSDSYSDGMVWDEVVPFLYNQTTFGIPPYKYYNIYKTRFTYYPFGPVKVTLDYVFNENKYAMAVDDNSTHQGIEVEYKPNNRLTLGLLYQYTRQIDLYKEFVTFEGRDFDGHHNMFASLDYALNEDQHLSLMFGEYVGYSYLYPEEHYALSALDTRHIIRFAYSGKWGGPYEGAGGALETERLPLGQLNPYIPDARFVANTYLGSAKYTTDADIVNVNSDWSAGFGKVEFGIDCYDKDRIDGGLRFGLFTSLEDTEDWDRSSSVYQRNDMDVRGADLNFDIGWAFNAPTKHLSFTPLLNAGYRRLEYERASISMLGTGVSQLGEVNETHNVAFLGIGGRLGYMLNNNFNIYTSGYYSPLLFTTINNESTGRFESDSGGIWHAEGGCDYIFSDRLDLTIGGFWDQQDIDKADRSDGGVVSAELPDSKLETVGVKLGGSYKF